MWPFRRKQGRRLDAARARAETRSQRWQRLREAGAPGGIGIALLFAVGCVLILMLGGRGVSHHPGQRLDKPLLVRVAFDAPDPRDPERALHFEPNDRLVDAGIIDDNDYALIQAEHKAYLATAGSLALHVLGLSGLALLVTAGLGIYVFIYQPRIVKKPARTLALAILLLLTLLATRVTVWALWQTSWHVFVGAGMLVLSAMVLTIAYNQRFALGAGWFTALLLVPAANQEFTFLLVLLAGVITVAMSLGTVRSRTKLVLVGAAAAGVMMLTMLVMGLIGGHWELPLLWNMLACGGAGLAAGLVMQGLLPVIERAFDIATAMTLLEFSDVSRPLLRRLASDAPGTFNHSLLLGTMAEAAAEAIGVNGLLTRVGAYYHDVGKINKPPYFAENQEGKLSRHDKLSPAMSLLIILGHVKDGVELVKEYNVPRVIWPFITEHHGTTLIEYFYHAARQAQGEQAPVSEAQFRYPGPKPQSKETAILMLCDSVEGATRALTEPNAAHIEDVVYKISRKRLDDGQLDECSLTLRELKTVEQSLTKSLLSFYHGRVQYPSSSAASKESPPAPAATSPKPA